MQTSSNSSNQKIELLPEHLIDQIKAGEVVERPSALIKELLENSIDANADEISIHIVDNGLELIRIEDNGDGISSDSLPLAFARHATSKIRRFEDIYSLNSFGFRGEALASICAISRLSCYSTCLENNNFSSSKITIHGGEHKSHVPWQGQKPGTTIVVEDLFYNTPARLKFVKSKQSEKNALKRMIYSFILSNPQVTFHVKWDDKEKKTYKSLKEFNPKTMEKRVKEVFFSSSKTSKGQEIDKNLEYFEGSYDGHQVKGFLSRHSTGSNTGKHHFLFANKRLFTDKSLHQTILRSAEKLWPSAENGHYFVMLKVPTDKIDVNIHPNKTQIKFLNFGVVYSIISNSIKKLITEIRPKQAPPPHSKSDEKSYDENLGSFHTGYIEQRDQVNQKYIPLTENFMAYRSINTNQTYLIDCKNLFWCFWKFISEKENISESEISPLLITRPIKTGHIHKDTLLFLENRGINIERISQSTFALRSLPSDVHSLEVETTILPYINFCIKNEIKSYHDLESNALSKEMSETFSFLPHELDIILEKLPISVLVEQKIAKSLTPINLTKFIHEA